MWRGRPNASWLTIALLLLMFSSGSCSLLLRNHLLRLVVLVRSLQMIYHSSDRAECGPVDQTAAALIGSHCAMELLTQAVDVKAWVWLNERFQSYESHNWRGPGDRSLAASDCRASAIFWPIVHIHSILTTVFRKWGPQWLSWVGIGARAKYVTPRAGYQVKCDTISFSPPSQHCILAGRLTFAG